MSEIIDYPIYGGPESFDEAHAKVIEMWGHVEPIDITSQDNETNYACRVRVSAVVEPPAIIQEVTTFTAAGEGHVVDRERTTVSVKDGEVVMGRVLEKQDRDLGPDNKPMGLWRSPEHPEIITGKERRVAFNGLMTAIENLS